MHERVGILFSSIQLVWNRYLIIVGNKAKEWISKRLLEENKVRKVVQNLIFLTSDNISSPLTSGGGEILVFGNFLFSWNHGFEILPFALLF